MVINHGIRYCLFATLLVAAIVPATAAPFHMAQASAAEIAFWHSVENSNDPAELEAYLKAYPKGQFAPLAKVRLDRLKRTKLRSTSPSITPASPRPSVTGTVSGSRVPPPPAATARGWIGAQVNSIDQKGARRLGLTAAAGAEIVAIVDYGPAAKHELTPHDVVVAVNGTPVVDAKHLIELISSFSPGQTADLTIVRNGARRTIKITVGNFFEDQWIAAHRGNGAAMLVLGNLFADGTLVAQDGPTGIAWIRKAADTGNSEAMGVLGHRYQFGRGVGRDDREAVRWYRKAAQGGNAYSMFSLGLLSYRGQGVTRDYAEAARWYRRAIEKGHAGAMHNYGTLLQDGLGVEKNEALAVDYFRRAAKLGQRESFPSIATAYYLGRGVPKDMAQAAHWYREAADRGVSTGYYGLGLMYENGEGGLPKSRAEAIKNYRKGAEAGDDLSLERLKKLNATAFDPKEIHQLLSELGFEPGRYRGWPSRKIGRAIRAFQKSRGLNVDGEASLRLVGQLRAALKQKQAANEKSKGSAPVLTRPREADFNKLKNLESLDSQR